MPSLLILLPLIGLIILNLPFRKTIYEFAFWFAVAVFSIQIVISIFHLPALWGEAFEYIDSFFKVGFVLDNLGFMALLSIGIVSLTSLIVARYTVHDEKSRFKFINLLIVESIGLCGIVITQDIFSMYVFLEITAIASFVLIAFEKDVYALEGSFKYMILSGIATIMMLIAIALILLVAPNTSFSGVSAALKESSANPFLLLAVGIFICGLFIKGGLVPFHGWLPDAYMSAPAPVSILLAGIVTKVSGIYTMIRLVTSVFGFTETIRTLLLAVGACSVVVGALAAMPQHNFKRMLAYSSVSQVGYILLGLGTGTPLGVAGAVFHFFNHAIFKSLLFVNSASVEKMTGTSNIIKMGGLSVKMPVTGATSVIAMLSACGIPPLAGFWSKLMIIIALWQRGNYSYASIGLLASILTLGYFLTLQRQAFFGKPAQGTEDIREVQGGIVFASITLAAIAIGAGILFPVIFSHLAIPIKEALIH